MKVVINKCFGGFSISREAAEYMASLGCEQAKSDLKENPERWYGYGYTDKFPNQYKRDSEYLVKAVEHLGARANNFCSELKVVEIPDGIDWQIDEYDGLEHVEEKHKTWW